ncbi:putative fad binding domain protein [Rhypophila decipiens]|uniref:Fad binding domain protein n=1 Tax=Rhypophila decipiens TaxID=261697 RepID=A0AAN6XT48_9PEZI|nr:putative fad binding domain protein [Rhypophila decipiens]
MADVPSPIAPTRSVIDSLEASLEHIMLLPNDPDYALRNGSYYSNSAKLRPVCILQPQSTSEVAEAVKTLVAGRHHFAVRSGGCNFWPSNNIDDGVTIDLNLLDAIEYDKEADTVSIGPGARWGQVYEELEKYDRTVGGGRETSVGVGGLVLSGGNNFFSGGHGLTCDQAIAFEVVLANGDIVLAKEGAEHGDLLIALRGGGSNFGVVTRITMRTIPCGLVWGGGRVFSTEVMFADAAKSLVEITDSIAEDHNHY